ncbi:Transposase ISC1316 [Conexivisphaera calida]|uniref:Transposase ISC1316 n=1 Tax=Conexivisphaera calida TaxID=1874277 RepID=A0A4P2VCW6_9ARCH|nr:Transposase ISC1316 [Conexivisphaera calida]
MGLKFRAYAGEEMARALRARLDAACALYNALRSADAEAYRERGKGLTQYELRTLALRLRREHDEFRALFSQVAQQVADRFYEAKERFFEGLARFPRAKKPHRYYSLVYPQHGWKVLDVRPIRSGKKRMMRIRFSNLGEFDVLVHRDFPLDEVARVIVKMNRAGEIYVIFYVEGFNPYTPLPSTGKVGGIDVGIEKLIATSDGQYAPNPRIYERALVRLRRLQRELSRKQRGSRRRLKVKRRLARAHERVANIRRDLYLKLGKILAELYDLVVMEDIDVKELIGKSYRSQRRRLHDVSFHELRAMIEYQMRKYGKEFAAVDPKDTSRTCARCGYVREDLTLGDRVYVCPACGWTADRDYNAALNILARTGRGPPVVPVELRPLPLPTEWQGGAMSREAPRL